MLALRSLGGSGTNEEIAAKVISLLELSEEQQLIPHGRMTEVEYRLAWARTVLKNIGAIERSSRGVWSLTEFGRELDEASVEPLRKEWQGRMNLARKVKPSDGDAADERVDLVPGDTDDDWKPRLIEVLRAMRPDAFERLFVRLLKEAGFVNVQATGGSGDDGIDGTGVYQVSLVSFPVYFQCKRWKNPVGSQEVRNFRGAMVGRAEHALLITTSTFTSNAKSEASRPGAPPIDLIDGERLVELLRSYSLGVVSVPRTVFDVTILPDFFQGV